MFKNFNKYGLNFFRLMFEKHKIITSIWIVLTISMSVFPSINVRLSKLSIDSINKISQDNAFYQLSIEFLLLIALSTIISSILSAIIVSLLVVKLLISGRLTNIEPLTFELQFLTLKLIFAIPS